MYTLHSSCCEPCSKDIKINWGASINTLLVGLSVNLDVTSRLEAFKVMFKLTSSDEAEFQIQNCICSSYTLPYKDFIASFSNKNLFLKPLQFKRET